MVIIKVRNEFEMEIIVEFVRKNKNDVVFLVLLLYFLLLYDLKWKVWGYVVIEFGLNGKMIYKLKKKRIIKYFISLSCVSCWFYLKL